MKQPAFDVADLCDSLGPEVVVLEGLRRFTERRRLVAQLDTVQISGENDLVRSTLSEPGDGRVLLVSTTISEPRAIVGDGIAGLASENDWAGIIVLGGVRDTERLASFTLGIWARYADPRRTHGSTEATRGKPIIVDGRSIEPGYWVICDEDGVAVVPSLPEPAAS